MNTPHYEPPWLEPLRKLDPDAAAVYDADPARASKLDALLAGVSDSETKIALIRTAINAGFAPDDPALTFAILAVGLQKLMIADYSAVLAHLQQAAEHAENASQGIIEASERAAGAAGIQTRLVQDEIRKSTKFAIAKIQKTGEEVTAGFARQHEAISSAAAEAKTTLTTVRTTLDDFPKFTADLHQTLREEVQTGAAEAVSEHAKAFAAGKIELEAKAITQQITTALEGCAKEVLGLRDTLAPLRKTIELFRRDEEVLVLGRALKRREWVALWSGLGTGTLLGVLLMGTLTTVLHLGVDHQLYADAQAGRVYRTVYPMLKRVCRTQITAIVDHGHR